MNITALNSCTLIVQKRNISPAGEIFFFTCYYIIFYKAALNVRADGSGAAAYT